MISSFEKISKDEMIAEAWCLWMKWSLGLLLTQHIVVVTTYIQSGSLYCYYIWLILDILKMLITVTYNLKWSYIQENNGVKSKYDIHKFR